MTSSRCFSIPLFHTASLLQKHTACWLQPLYFPSHSLPEKPSYHHCSQAQEEHLLCLANSLHSQEIVDLTNWFENKQARNSDPL